MREPWIITHRAEAEDLNRVLLEQPFATLDSEWYRHDTDKHPAYNGLACVVTMAYRDHENQVQPVFLYNYGMSDGNIYAIKPWLESPEHIKSAHNCPVDAHIIMNHGINVKSLCVDTMVADYLLDENRENRHGLKECMEDHFGVERLSFKQTFGKVKLKKDGTPYASGQYEEFDMEYVLNNPHEVRRKDGSTNWDILIDYSVADAVDGLSLYEYFKPKLEAIPWGKGKTYWDYFYNVECKMTEIITHMERKGMYLDIPFLSEMREKATKDLEKLEYEIAKIAGCPINVASGKQLTMLLFGKGRQPIYHKTSKKRIDFYIDGYGLPVNEKMLTDKGAPKTDAAALKDLKKRVKDERIQQLITYIADHSKISTQKGTFLEGLSNKSINSRIHTRANQIGTTSGRLSSSGPNLQNITTGDKDVYNLRDAFTAPIGYLLIVADFGQLEYRLLAHFSQEPKLLQLFAEGWDLHSLTCYNIYDDVKSEVNERFGTFTVDASKWVSETFPDQRKKAKTLNFEIIYGVGHYKLADQLGIDPEEGKRMIDGWFQGYPYVKAWMNRELANARKIGYGKTLIGRYRRPHPDRIHSDNYKLRGEEERTFINGLIQGSAADVCERAMILIDDNKELRELGCALVMQIHDELVLEAPRQNAKKCAAIIKDIMENPFSKPLRVALPVSVGVGPTWATSKK